MGQSMRIWYVTDARLPGQAANTVQIMKMCAAFGTVGHDVSLFVRLGKNSVDSAELFRSYAVPANFRINRAPRLIPGQSSRDHWSLPFTLSALPWLRSNVRRFDLLYTRLPLLASLAARCGVRVVYEAHRLLPTEGWFARRIAQTVAQNSRRDAFAGLVGISQVLSRWYSDFGVSPSKILPAHDGVDLERFTPVLTKSEARLKLELPSHRPMVCYCGHLYRGRGTEELLSCAQAMPETLFLFVGGSDGDVAKYRTFVQDHSLENVRLTGFKPNGELPAYLYAADVLAMPYTQATGSAAFMSPMKLFEYLAAGRPIVASDFPSIREVLQHHVNAILVSPGDSSALRRGLEEALDPVVSDILSQNARQDSKRFTWEIRARRITEFVSLSRSPH